MGGTCAGVGEMRFLKELGNKTEEIACQYLIVDGVLILKRMLDK